jgi:hypothetical protein
MSGYLQRLAAGAIRPARSIHPVVGTLYAPMSQQPSMESPEEVHVETSLPQTPAGRETSPFERPLVKSFAPQPRRRHSDAGLQIAPRRSGSKENPSLAEIGGATVEKSALRPGPGQAAATSAGPNEASEDIRESSAEPASLSSEYHPLVRTSPVSALPNSMTLTEPHNLREMRASASPQNNRNAGSTRPAQPQHEPDEIQIHIGRIEVTAVQPAATPRPAPKERNKSVSLDEYLSRRNGRS